MEVLAFSKQKSGRTMSGRQMSHTKMSQRLIFLYLAFIIVITERDFPARQSNLGWNRVTIYLCKYTEHIRYLIQHLVLVSLDLVNTI